MKDIISENKDEEKAPAKKVKIGEEGPEEVSDLAEDPSGMEDVNEEVLGRTATEESTEAMDEVMSLGVEDIPNKPNGPTD